MSETKDPRRTRRRASRTAGPPVEEATEKLATGTSATEPDDVTEKLATGASATEPHAQEDVTEKLATGSAQPETVKLPAGSTESATAKLPSSPAASGTEKPAAGSGSATTAKLSSSSAGSETAKLPVGEAESVTEKLTSTPTGTTGAGSAAVHKEATGASAPTVRLGKAEAEPAGSPGASAEAATVALDKKGSAEEAGTAAADAGDEPGAGAWKRILALTAAAVLVIGLVGAAVVSMIAVQSTEQRDERRAEYVATARQTILNLTTIRADTAKEDIDRILTMASGEFKTEFDGRIDPFTEIVKQAKVQSTGEVVEAAVERDDEKSAVILVAAKQTLTNAGAEGEQQRFYRFRVTVQRADDGTLTASDVEFVA